MVVVVRVLGGEADASEHLQRALAGAPPVAPGQRLDHLAVARRRGLEQEHRLADHAVERDAVGLGPRQEVPDRLEGPDGLAELLAVAGVVDGQVDGALGGAEHLRRGGHPAEEEAPLAGLGRGVARATTNGCAARSTCTSCTRDRPGTSTGRSSTASTSTTATPRPGWSNRRWRPSTSPTRTHTGPRRAVATRDGGHDRARRDGGALDERLGDDAAERGAIRRARGPAPGSAANTADRASSSSRWARRSHHPSASSARGPGGARAWPGPTVVEERVVPVGVVGHGSRRICLAIVSSCICCEPPYTVTIRENRYSWRSDRDLRRPAARRPGRGRRRARSPAPPARPRTAGAWCRRPSGRASRPRRA